MSIRDDLAEHNEENVLIFVSNWGQVWTRNEKPVGVPVTEYIRIDEVDNLIETALKSRDIK